MTRKIPFPGAMAALALMVTAGAPSARAGSLDIQLTGCAQTQGTVGPITASCSTASGQGQAFANYTTLGVSAAVGAAQSFTSIAQMADSITVGGIPTGTQVDLIFLTSYDGTYAFSAGPSSDANISTTVLLTYNGAINYIIDGGQSLQLCGTGLEGTDPGCTAFGSSLAGVAPGVTLASTQVVATAGTAVPITIEFALTEDTSMGASVSADFLDPFTLTNILVTDPNTGLPIAGATIMGASGTTYPVNVVSSAPEPSTLGSIASGVFLIGAFRRYRNKPSK
jgi:hypothetical protein